LPSVLLRQFETRVFVPTLPKGGKKVRRGRSGDAPAPWSNVDSSRKMFGRLEQTDLDCRWAACVMETPVLSSRPPGAHTLDAPIDVMAITKRSI